MDVYTYKLFVFVCTPVLVYGQFDRCWIAIVMDFNAYCTALHTGGWHRLLARCNCEVWEPEMVGSVTKAHSHDEGSG